MCYKHPNTGSAEVDGAAAAAVLGAARWRTAGWGRAISSIAAAAIAKRAAAGGSLASRRALQL